MRIIYLSNNPSTNNLYNWLKNQENVELMHCREKIVLPVIQKFNPDLVLSYGYRYIIKEPVIELFKGRIINLHISYLPYNRGADPNIWSLLEDTPKGVTIHFIDKGVDTGDILFQRKVEINTNIHTLKTSYELLHEEIQNLFFDNWNKISRFKFSPQRQIENGSTHYIKDFDLIKDKLLGEKEWDIPLNELIENYRKQ